LAGYLVSRSTSSSGTYTLLTGSPIGASAFVDTLAPSGTKSYYRVTASDRSGNVSSASSTSATRPSGPASIPASPNGVSASVAKTGVVTVKWSAVSGATGYLVARGTAASGPFTRITTSTLTTTSFVDGGAPAGAVSWYSVTAVNPVGSSTGTTVSATVPADTTPPAAPSSAKAVVSGSGMTVSWKANAEADLAGYLVFARDSTGVYVQTIPAAGAAPLTTTSFTDPGATEGTTTYYRIRAVDRSGNQSSYSAVTGKNPNVAPGVPTGFTVKQDATSGLDLAWVAPKDNDVAGYSISRSTTSSGTYVLLSTITVAAAGSSPRFIDTSAPKGVTVYYRVTAQDLVGNVSKASSTVSGTSLTAPTPIQVPVTVLTVGADKQFSTVTSALASIPTNSLKNYRLDIDPGTYNEAFELSQSNVTLHGLGTDSSQVVIAANRASGTPDPSQPGTTYGTAGSAVVFVSGTNDTLTNLTVRNDFDELADPTITRGQAVALRVEGDRFVADTVRLLGNQDTLLADTPKPTTRVRQYYVNSYFEGDVDYLFGAGTAVFDRDTFNSLDRNKSTNGYLTAASTDSGSKYGFLITDSKVLSDAAPGTINLGRPWHPSADPAALGSVVIKNTYLPAAVDTVGRHVVHQQLGREGQLPLAGCPVPRVQELRTRRHHQRQSPATERQGRR
jgi:pectin methylesterase-like acyl-CoA thioesterase